MKQKENEKWYSDSLYEVADLASGINAPGSRRTNED